MIKLLRKHKLLLRGLPTMKKTYNLSLSTIIKTVAGFKTEQTEKTVFNTNKLPAFDSEILKNTLPIIESVTSKRGVNCNNVEYIDGALIRGKIEQTLAMEIKSLYVVLGQREIDELLNLHMTILPVPYYFTTGEGSDLEKGFYTDVYGSMHIDDLLDAEKVLSINADCYADFNRKASNVNEIRKGEYSERDRYGVVETVTLDLTTFLSFGNNLMEKHSFLEKRGGHWSKTQGLPDVTNFFEFTPEQQTEYKKGAYRACVKVQCFSTDYSFLVDPQGYDYARYTAVVAN